MTKPLIKICGLTRAQDVALCHDLGVDFTGFIFAAKSPRFIAPEKAALLPSGPARRVGVFVNEDLNAVQQIARTAKLDLLQLHGGESVEYCKAVGAQRVIKVLWPDRLSPDELQKTINAFADSCAYFLLDAGTQGGGSGQTLDWEKLTAITFPKPWLLAGGLGPQTLATARSALITNPPDGFDLNSALESAPGIKDEKLVKAVYATSAQS